MMKNRDHHRPINGVKGFFEIHKGDNQWKLVFSKAFHDSSQNMDLPWFFLSRGSR